MKTILSRAATVCLMAVAAAAVADDLWLAPSAWRPKAGDEVSIRLMVGPKFSGRSRPRDDARIDAFLVRGWDAAEIAVAGKTGDDPAGRVVIPEDGTWIVGFRSKPANITLDAEKFEAYLAANGLTAISEERARRGESKEKGRETYSRGAKAVLSVGKGEPGGYDRSLGLRLEITPERHPYRCAPGDEVPFRVTFDGAAIEGLLVRARSEANPDPPVEGRTDAEGRVKLRLADAGAWFVGAVHMFRSDATKTFSDWESVWGSITFELPAKAAAAAAPVAPSAPDPPPAKK